MNQGSNKFQVQLPCSVGWHTFRPSLATNLRTLSVDIKVAQELLRHASCRTTLDIYTPAVSEQKRDANAKVVGMILPVEMMESQHPSAPSATVEAIARHLQLID
jgi:hypothetical protein